MIWYLFLIFLIFIFKKSLDSKKMTLADYIVYIYMVSICGLRYMVGSDYLYYIKMYGDIDRYVRVEFFERIIIKLFNHLNFSVYFFIFFMAAITFWILFKAIKKNSKKPAVTLFMFVTFGYFAMAFNGVRQALAIVIGLYSIKYIFENHMLKYIISILFATLCHKTALVMLPLYFLKYIKLDKKKMYILFFIMLLSFVLYNPLMNFITTNFEQYKVYSIRDNLTFWVPGAGTYIISLFHLILILLSIKNIDKLKEKSFKNDIYVKIFLMSTVFYSLNMVNALMSRMAMYFSVFSIYLLPDLFEIINKKKDKLINFIIYTMLVLYFIVHIVSFNDMLPYRTIFEVIIGG